MPNINRMHISKRMLIMLIATGAYSVFMYLQAPGPVTEIAQQETNWQNADVTGERIFSRDMEVEESSPGGEARGNTVPYYQGRRSEQYPVARYPSPAADYRPVASGSVQFNRRTSSAQASGVSISSTSGGHSDSRGEQATSVPVQAEPRELTPEEINPFLPDGSVADDTAGANRQAKIECPTFITGQMKTRYSYELLESIGCGPGFDY